MACQICGKPSGFYPLCNSCFKLRDEGKLDKCEECGKWIYKGKSCSCGKSKTVVKEAPKSESESSELKCIICGENSNGKHFCYNCYQKYKGRSVDIRITHCTDVEILDEYGNLTIKTDDGRRVRSRAEALISNWLFKEKIRSIYERTLYYEEDGESKTLHPDFYLPDYDVYIEYNELTNKPYLKKRDYVLKIYEQLDKKVIVMNDQDLNDIEACLKPKLRLN